MANSELVQLLSQGVKIWNGWRKENPNIKIDLNEVELLGFDLSNYNLSGALLNRANLAETNLNSADLANAILIESNLYQASFRRANLYYAKLSKSNMEFADLRGAYLGCADLSNCNLRRAELDGTFLEHADLSGAILVEARGYGNAGEGLKAASMSFANLSEADLSRAQLGNIDFGWAILSKTNLNGTYFGGAKLDHVDFRGANFIDTDLSSAQLTEADLSGAVLVNVNLTESILVRTKIDNATISGSLVHAINVWDLVGEFRDQKDLVITAEGDPVITVDNIKIAQFVYLILNNKEIRNVINELTSKCVLILGRFSPPERKVVLDALRNKLREYNLLPIVFDFDHPTNKDITETIKTLAGLCYFVIADITNPKSTPLELQAIVPDNQVPFILIIQEGEQPFTMMANLQTKYPWVLDTISYDSLETLIGAIKPAIIDPAIKKHNELSLIKAKSPNIKSAKDFLSK